jgi:hypothetical protein
MTRIFGLDFAKGIVSVTIISVSLELFMRSNAGPDKTACVQMLEH